MITLFGTAVLSALLGIAAGLFLAHLTTEPDSVPEPDDRPVTLDTFQGLAPGLRVLIVDRDGYRPVSGFCTGRYGGEPVIFLE